MRVLAFALGASVLGALCPSASTAAALHPSFNNDARADLVFASGSSFTVATSTGSKFLGESAVPWRTGVSTNAKYRDTGDFNGDGRADVLIGESNLTYSVVLSNGARFEGSGSGLWQSGWGSVNWMGAGDVNGDRKDDLILEGTDHRIYVAISTGTAFNGPGSGEWLRGWGPWSWSSVADVTGDGKDDFVALGTDNKIYVGVSNGSGFATVGTGIWLSGWGPMIWKGLGDFNGDGKDDFVGQGTDNKLYVGLSTGSSFVVNGTGIWLSGWGGMRWRGLGDFNGDGKDDFIAQGTDNVFYVGQSTGSAFTPIGTGIWLAGWPSDPSWIGVSKGARIEPMVDGSWQKDSTTGEMWWFIGGVKFKLTDPNLATAEWMGMGTVTPASPLRLGGIPTPPNGEITPANVSSWRFGGQTRLVSTDDPTAGASTKEQKAAAFLAAYRAATNQNADRQMYYGLVPADRTFVDNLAKTQLPTGWVKDLTTSEHWWVVGGTRSLLTDPAYITIPWMGLGGLSTSTPGALASLRHDLAYDADLTPSNIASWRWGGSDRAVNTDSEADAVIDVLRGQSDADAATTTAGLSPADRTIVSDRAKFRFLSSALYGGDNLKVDNDDEASAFYDGYFAAGPTSQPIMMTGLGGDDQAFIDAALGRLYTFQTVGGTPTIGVFTNEDGTPLVTDPNNATAAATKLKCARVDDGKGGERRLQGVKKKGGKIEDFAMLRMQVGMCWKGSAARPNTKTPVYFVKADTLNGFGPLGYLMKFGANNAEMLRRREVKTVYGDPGVSDAWISQEIDTYYCAKLKSTTEIGATVTGNAISVTGGQSSGIETGGCDKVGTWRYATITKSGGKVVAAPIDRLN